ncbi:MAG: ABC transporter ATP-binding protein [Planctomycetota bacterium]|nr:ABC transporter ATP-binding protein [Planctomycetota bacterium]
MTSSQSTPVDSTLSPGSPEAIMRVEGLHKAFGRNQVLRGLDLAFQRASTTVVMGPSGCGKSVLLKHLVGLLRPDSGEVWFEDKRIDQVRESSLGPFRRRIGFLFQQGALFDSMSVGDNVEFPLREHADLTLQDRSDRVERMLDMVGMPGTQDRNPATLSGGQRKRIALARAVVLEPDIVLYDEPTTGLDPIRSDIIGELISRLQKALQLTSIVVTHDVQLSFRIADRMVLLHEGRVHMQGSPDSFRTTEDPEVRRFLEGRATHEELAGLQPVDGEETNP